MYTYTSTPQSRSTCTRRVAVVGLVEWWENRKIRTNGAKVTLKLSTNDSVQIIVNEASSLFKYEFENIDSICFMQGL